jgi:hypothetical protein
MARNITNRFLICDKVFINIYETFADTKGVARSRNLKKDRQYKGKNTSANEQRISKYLKYPDVANKKKSKKKKKNIHLRLNKYECRQ